MIGQKIWPCWTFKNLSRTIWLMQPEAGSHCRSPRFQHQLTDLVLTAGGFFSFYQGSKASRNCLSGKHQLSEKMAADATWHFSSNSVQNTNPTPNLVNVLLCAVKRTGTGVPVLPLMISVLLLLWTLAACRGLWRGRYVHLISSPLTWFLCVLLFVSPLSLEGKAEFHALALSLRQRQ